MCSNLSPLSCMLLRSVQEYTVFRSCWNDTTSWVESIWLTILVSSAKLDRKDRTSPSSISPNRMRNRRGPNTDPCGTPDNTSSGCDLPLFTRTTWDRLVRKLKIHFQTSPLIPRSESFCRVIPKSTLSNAFAKSIYIISTFPPFSRSSRIRS